MGDPNVISTDASGRSKHVEDLGIGGDMVRDRRKGNAKAAGNLEQNGGEQSVDSTMQDESSSIAGSTSGRHPNGPKKNVRERYHSVKQQYPELIKRLNRHRTQTPNSFDWTMGAKNPLVMSATQTPFTNVLRGEKNSTPKESAEAARMAIPPDVSAVEPSAFKLNHSFTYPEDLNVMERQSVQGLPSDSVDDDFVNSKRRMRRTRTTEFPERAPSRGARSEMGDIGPYSGAYNPYRMHSAQPHFYDPRSYYSSSREYADGRRSVGPMYQHYPYDAHAAYPDNLARRRPQSSFDAMMNHRYERSDSRRGMLSAYDAEEEFLKKSDSSSSRRDDSGSDEEVAAIHYQQEMMAKRASAARFEAPAAVSDEYYYFGVIQLPQDRVQTILHKSPPPPDYFHLPPIEKAAYLFYFVLYNRYFAPAVEFHNRFNREFYKYSCEGDSAETALWKICKHTQEEFVARRSAYQLKAYEKTQKQLFSDDRETPDSRVSDHGSRDEHDEESDRLSVDSASKEPLKFRTSHAFARFGIGGKLIVVNLESSQSVIELRDVKTLVAELETKRVIEAIEIFHGPLIAGVTPPHSVGLYVQRQIDRIIRSDVYKANPYGSDASDCLLVWQLLKMVVQQQGRVTGPDISRLLMSDFNASSIAEGHRTISSPGSEDAVSFQRYMQFLLGGHVDEAIESALKDGLILDAMVLARWVCPHKLEKVDAAFLSQRAEQNPVMTLLSVAHDLPAPILTNPPTDESGSWRSHAAIILANLATETAFKMVYNLGRVLARREYHAAADFCFLAVSLLADYDPFQPVALSEDDDARVRQHITLIHASLPDDDVESVRCCYGFSVIDLHATEIFEYGVRLAYNGLPVRLTHSCDYQKYRFQYAQLLSEYGGFASDAYRYCVEVAKGVAERWSDYGQDEILQLCDLAERLQHVACADKGEIAWFSDMRSFIKQSHAGQVGHTVQASDQYQEVNNVNSVQAPSLTVDAVPGKTRTLSFGSEAAEWHADHQEPIQMSPIASSVPPAFAPQLQSQTIGNNVQSAAIPDIYSVDETQQHHILGQRRASAASGTSTHAEAPHHSGAFPPSLPPTKETHEVIESRVRTVSVNETKQVEPPTAQYNYYQNDSSKYFFDDSRKQLNIHHQDRRDANPELFITETDSSNGISSATSSSPESTPSRKQHLTEVSTALEVPSPSGMDDSVFLSGNEPSHFPPAFAPEIMSQPMHSKQNHLNDFQHPSSAVNDASMIPPAVQTPQLTPRVDDNKLTKPTDGAKPLSASSHSSGIFSMLKAKIVKAIPSGNEMILPDDKNPSIVWDPVQQKYVGSGVEEEKVDSKPPSTANSTLFSSSGQNSNVGLTAARLSGGSRYFNPLNDNSAAQGASVSPAPMLPPMMVPPSFGFIPTAPDDDDATAESPFSIDASPMVPSNSAPM